MTKILTQVLDELRKEENVIELSTKKGFEFNFGIEFYYSHNGKIYNTILELCLDYQFPKSFPRVYVNDVFFDKIGWIPHLEKDKIGDKYLCLYNTVNTQIVPGNHIELVRDSLDRARRTIREGIEGSNFSDYDTEFQAYWRRKYRIDDKLVDNILIWGDIDKNHQILDLVSFEHRLGKYTRFLFTNSNESDNVYSNLFSKKATLINKVLVLNEIKIQFKPPYIYSTKDLLEIFMFSGIKSEDLEFYFNTKHPKHIIIAKVQSTQKYNMFIGWDFTQKDLNGFRTLWDKVRVNSNSNITRLIVDHFSKNRLLERTKGSLLNNNSRVNNPAFIGLGSVGSQLLGNLLDNEFNSISLFDNDILSIENIKRHLLGLDYISKTKVKALKEYISYLKPETEINCNDRCIESIISNHLYWDKFDFIFIAVGLEKIEQVFRKELYNKNIITPLCFFWVEPYLSGGHILYMPEGIDPSYESKLYKNTLYLNNIINEKEYINLNPIFMKSDYGCQSEFIPYSGNDLKLFLSSIHMIIDDLMTNTPNKLKSYTWVGNIDFIKTSGISINSQYHDKKFGDIIEHE